MARLAQPEINCSICNKPVDLESAKTDDDGKTVHGECYVFRLAGSKLTNTPLTVLPRKTT